MPRLIVNADDFGYTGGINRAIFELHAAGALSSATLMANGAALEDVLASLPVCGGVVSHVRVGRPLPSELGIGCHVVLVDGTPVSVPGELPTLVPAARSGAPATFRPTLGGFVADLLRGRIREAEIEREAIAQIRLLQARGIRLTHVDTHKHTHMFARVLRPLLRAALACGVNAIRNPFEPAWSVRATPDAPLIRRAEVRLLSLLRPEFARLVAQAGLHTTAGALGVVATGTLDARTIERLLAAATREARDETQNEELTWELVCHPGHDDAALRAQPTRLLAARETERAALLATLPALRGFTLTNFGELSA